MADETETKEVFNALGGKQKKEYYCTLYYTATVTKIVYANAYDEEEAKDIMVKNVEGGKEDLADFDEVEEIDAMNIEYDDAEEHI